MTRFQEKVEEAQLNTQLAQEKISAVKEQLAKEPAIAEKTRENLANAIALVGQSNKTLAAAERGMKRVPPTAPAAQTSSWVIVVGADRSLDDAEHEINRLKTAGFGDAFIMRRDNWYRTVIPVTSRSEADAQLEKVSQEIRKGAYIRNLAEWCASLNNDPAHKFRDCGDGY